MPPRLSALFVALTLLTPLASAQDGRPDTQANDHFSEPGFTAVVLLVSDSSFFEEWQRPETPRIQTDTRYTHGETAYPVLIFQTDAVDEQGHANLTYDLAVIRPDGAPYTGTPLSGLLAWEGAPTPALSLSLGQARLLIEEGDPLGLYRVKIVVHDNVGGRSVPLTLSFEVVEEG
jgi:hypothetical protein